MAESCGKRKSQHMVAKKGKAKSPQEKGTGRHNSLWQLSLTLLAAGTDFMEDSYSADSVGWF